MTPSLAFDHGTAVESVACNAPDARNTDWDHRRAVHPQVGNASGLEWVEVRRGCKEAEERGVVQRERFFCATGHVFNRVFERDLVHSSGP